MTNPPPRRGSSGSGPIPPHPGSRRSSLASPPQPGGGFGTPSNVPLPSSRRPSFASPPPPGPDTPSKVPLPSSRRPSFVSPQRPGPETPGSGHPISGGRPHTPSSRHGTPGSGPPPTSNRPPFPGNRPPFPSNRLLFSTRPLSDEELISAFTPREQNFYRWYLQTKNERDRLKHLETDSGAHARFVKEKWPDREEHLAYNKWCQKWLDRHMERLFYRMPDAEFFGQLRTTNLTKREDLGRLGWTLNMCNIPMVILGEATFDGVFTGYAFRPSSNFLHPSPSRKWSTENRPDLTHESALAINLKVRLSSEGFPVDGVREVKKALVLKNGQSVPDSVEVNTTNNLKDKPRFVFAQLGELCVYIGDWKTARTKSRDDIVGGTWQITGFGVVAEVTSKGVPHALWAIFNTQLPVEPLGDKTNRTHDLGGDLGGWIFKDPSTGSKHSSGNRFFAARIADNLREHFGPTKKLNLEIVSETERMITRAMIYEPFPGQPGIFPMLMEDTTASK